jgi:hypothetical protein
MRRLVTILQRERVLIRMGSDALYVHHSAIERLRIDLQRMRGQSLDVARFKELTVCHENTPFRYSNTLNVSEFSASWGASV